jgi:hypothetical protein
MTAAVTAITIEAIADDRAHRRACLSLSRAGLDER